MNLDDIISRQRKLTVDDLAPNEGDSRMTALVDVVDVPSSALAPTDDSREEEWASTSEETPP